MAASDSGHDQIAASETGSTSSRSPPPAPVVKGQRGAPRRFWCCGATSRQPITADEVKCDRPYGCKAHPTMNRFHMTCLLRKDANEDFDDAQWTCKACRTYMAQKQRGSSPVGSDDGNSQNSRHLQSSQTPSQGDGDDQQEWTVNKIHAERIVDKGTSEETVQYLVEWELVDERPVVCTWEPREGVESLQALDDWENVGKQAAFGGRDEVVDFDPAALMEDLAAFDPDALTGNPFGSHIATYEHLLKALWPKVKAHPACKHVPNYETFAQDGYEILASMPWNVLHAIMSGGLIKRKLKDPRLYETLDENRSNSVDHACIYRMELCDIFGASLTLSEAEQLLEDLRTYAQPRMGTADETTDLALRVAVDNVDGSLTANEQGYRYGYGGSLQCSYIENKSHLEYCNVFCDSLESCLQAFRLVGWGDDDVLPFVLGDVGYTRDGVKRIIQHEVHDGKGCTRLMGMCDAATRHRHGNKYTLHGEVVFLCFRHGHASRGEIIFSELAQAYVETGKGFNGARAGSNLNALHGFKNSDWDKWAADVWNKSCLNDNLNAEDCRVEARRKVESDVEASRHATVMAMREQAEENIFLHQLLENELAL